MRPLRVHRVKRSEAVTGRPEEAQMWDFVVNNWSGVLFLLLVLACPRMHAFGHRGHRHADHHGANER